MRLLRPGTLALLALSLGCGSKVVDRLEEFADQACKCSDAACAQKVQAEFKAWAAENENARGSEKHRKRAEKAMKRYAECVDKLLVGSAPADSAAPSAPEPADSAPGPEQPSDPTPGDSSPPASD